MKLNNYKIKIKHPNFEPISKKSEYSYDDIMYLYYEIQFKSKDCKFTFSSGDCGHKLLEFIQELKLLIQDKYPYAQFDGCRVSILDNSSLIDEATGDSSFKAIKKVYDDTTHYSLILKNPNGQSLVFDGLYENDVMKFIYTLEREFDKLFEFRGKVDSVLLEIGEEFEWDLYDVIVEDLARGIDKGGVIFHYYQLLQHKYKVDSLVGSFAIEKIRLNSKDRVELYRGYNGELNVEELIEKYKEKVVRK